MDKIGRYTIEQVLGSGGMATVYLARDPFIGRPVAIKLMAHQLAHDEKLRQRFYQEAKLIASLESPNIVTIYDFGEQEGQPFLVMPYLTGGSLRGRLNQRREQKKPYNLAELLPIVQKIAEALHIAHQANIVHRDVKPDNVLFDGHGNPYLSDFGIARQEGVTYGTAFLGSPTYISPEQAKGRKDIDGRSDTYSLAAMVYEMLALSPPFAEGEMWELVRQHIEQPIPDICQIRPDLGPAVQAILEKAMAKEPALRYHTTLDFVAALRSLLALPQQYIATTLNQSPPPLAASTPPPPGQPPTLTSPPSLPQGRLPYFFIGVGATLLLLLLYGFVAQPLLSRAIASQTPTRQVAQATLRPSATPTLRPTTTPSPSPSPTVSPSRTPTATDTPTPTPTLGIGSSRISPVDGMRQVYVPAGTFSMGGESGNDDSLPVHGVYLDPFWMDETEITNAMYVQCMLAGACQPPATYGSNQRSNYYRNPAYDNYPVIYVSWDDANAYCTWAGRTLPTEAQWEKAARGDDSRNYPWGNEEPTCDLLNYDNCVGDTTEVGSYPDGASPYGVLDMAGNVWEWVADWYAGDYYETSPAENPLGPDSGTSKVLRGGSWGSGDDGVRVASRNSSSRLSASSSSASVVPRSNSLPSMFLNSALLDSVFWGLGQSPSKNLYYTSPLTGSCQVI